MRRHCLQIFFLVVLVVLCLGMNWIASSRGPQTAKHNTRSYEIIREMPVARSQSGVGWEKCPPCELFFRKLESSATSGKLVQDVKVQQRGEPKSGTSFMYDWATATLIRTCDYLNQLFGEHIYSKTHTKYIERLPCSFRLELTLVDVDIVHANYPILTQPTPTQPNPTQPNPTQTNPTQPNPT